MIVIGTRRRTGLRAALLGSVSREVTRARCVPFSPLRPPPRDRTSIAHATVSDRRPLRASRTRDHGQMDARTHWNQPSKRDHRVTRWDRDGRDSLRHPRAGELDRRAWIRRCRHAEKEAKMLTKLDARSEAPGTRSFADRAVAARGHGTGVAHINDAVACAHAAVLELPPTDRQLGVRLPRHGVVVRGRRPRTSESASCRA